MTTKRPVYQEFASPEAGRAALLKAVSEADLQRQIVHAARMLGWAVYHTTIAFRSGPGWPDLVLCKPPRLIFAELKTWNGKLSKAQEKWLDDLNHVPGVDVFVWRPADIEQAMEVLSRE